jgi:6-phosphogluconolactonase
LTTTRKIFPSPLNLAEAFAIELAGRTEKARHDSNFYTLVLSGGNTPNLLFSILGDNFATTIKWKYVHLFWGDERCVSQAHKESNYGIALRNLIDKIDIPDANIHRIKGEQDPKQEALRYSKEIIDYTRSRNGLPLFDLIILGLGEDGHIASIFPGNPDLFNSNRICEVTQHPVTFQNRITLTGPVINNADSVVFLVNGKNKARIVSDILNKKRLSSDYPADKVIPEYGSVEWFLDEDAASLLN